MSPTGAARGATMSVLGAAGTVTGSKFLIDDGRSRVLVDCGLFQGPADLRARNWAELPLDPASIQAVVVTHAHLDHCGYLPRLVRAGFRGPVYATADTAALMAVVLPDSARLQEEEAEFANRHGYSRHRPALPLYTESDAKAALRLVDTIDFAADFHPAPAITCHFDPAGHILGSAIVQLTVDGGPAPLVARFSGDLGRDQHPLLRPPAELGAADVVLVESTYGDRRHSRDDDVGRLADLIVRTVERGGVMLIPAFAVDRTEVLLVHLASLFAAGRLPDVPVYVDSPMALAGLRVYRRALQEAHADVRRGLDTSRIFHLPELHEVHDTEQSKRLSARHEPAIIIAGSGMATGGRVVHHLEHFLGSARNSVGLVGFQAAGTRGRALLDGADVLKLHGRYVPVRAEIGDLTGFSVHADQDELLAWLRTAAGEPMVYVVHGEPEASTALRQRIRADLGWTAVTPAIGERLRLV